MDNQNVTAQLSDEEQIHKNNKIALQIKNTLDDMICENHNKRAKFNIWQDLRFDYEKPCCPDFEKNILEAKQSIIDENR